MRQLLVILWKNWLLKKSNIIMSMLEIFIPALLLSLLVIIKSYTEVINSPNVSYFCGNIYPWYYTDSLLDDPSKIGTSTLSCLIRPTLCDQNNFYRNGVDYNIPMVDINVDFYTENGYIDSSFSAGASRNPFYAFTIGDSSKIYDELQIDNPSLPFSEILSALQKHRVLLALAPAIENDESLMEWIQSFKTYLLIKYGNIYINTLKIFPSLKIHDSYILNKNYDDENYEVGKIGISVIINEANFLQDTWDYTIRMNHTYIFESQFPSVTCLYNNHNNNNNNQYTSNNKDIIPNQDCRLTYTLPSTKHVTDDYHLPQSSEYLYGYSYSGFLTVQQTIDQFLLILSVSNNNTSSSSDSNSHNNNNDNSSSNVNINPTDKIKSMTSYYSNIYHSSNKSINNNIEITSSIGLMPTPSYTTDTFPKTIQTTLGLLYIISFLFYMSRITRTLVLEKETKIKEDFKIMGLNNNIYNCSWVITYTVQNIIISLLILLVTQNSVFQYSNKTIIFLLFFIFCNNILTFCFFISTFFSQSKVASLLAPVLFISLFFPYYTVNNQELDSYIKYLVSVLSPTCFALMGDSILLLESSLVGCQWDNIFISIHNFSIGIGGIILVVDSLVYMLLAWYLEQVLPSEYGTPKSPFFLFAYEYWRGVVPVISPPPSSDTRSSGFLSINNNNELNSPLLSTVNRNSSNNNAYIFPNDDNNADNREIEFEEDVTADLKQQHMENKCIEFRNVRKVFGKSGSSDAIVAVDNLSFVAYEGQVTALLGHNGAGKTTTISMLTGLLPLTSGDIIVRGASLTQELSRVQQMLGVCPQHDVLLSELTVKQHLEIFAGIKNISSKAMHNIVTEMMLEIGLLDQANTRAGALSGGQKRKLSLGIAFIGHSKVIVLDEPTSGMDPLSRKKVWSLIQKYKRDRIILLITHFMDEADMLGDRIAVMTAGRLNCIGSSLFLKNTFGVGYTFTVTTATSTSTSNTNTSNASSSSNQQIEVQKRGQPRGKVAGGSDTATNNVDALKDTIVRFIGNCDVLRDSGHEIQFRLPSTSTSTGNIGALLMYVDSHLDELGVVQYGISLTTLEEVFLKIESNRDTPWRLHNHSSKSSSSSSDDSNDDGGSDTNRNSSSYEEEKDLKIDNTDLLHIIYQGSDVTGNTSLDQDSPSSSPSEASSRSFPLLIQHFLTSISIWMSHMLALLMKRYLFGIRDLRSFMLQLLIPSLLLILGLLLLQQRPSFEQKELLLSLQLFNQKYTHNPVTFIPYYSRGDIGDQLLLQFNRHITNSSSSGSGGSELEGILVPITSTGQHEAVWKDQFHGCSQGSEPLHTMSNYLLSDSKGSKFEGGRSRYGAVTIAENSTRNHLIYNVLVNASANHGAPVYVNIVHQAYLQLTTGNPKARIRVRSHPLPRTYNQRYQLKSIDGFTAALFLAIAFCLVPAAFAVFVVKERRIGAKHQQLMTGVSGTTYWLSSFLWDCTSYLPTVVAVVLTLRLFSVSLYTSGDTGTCALLLLLAFGPSSIAFTYLLSLSFTCHSTAQTFLMLLNFITGLCLMIITFVLNSLPASTAIATTLRSIFRIFPAFCLSDGFARLSLCSFGNTCILLTSEGLVVRDGVTPYSYEVAGGDLLWMVVESLVYFILVLVREELSTRSLPTWSAAYVFFTDLKSKWFSGMSLSYCWGIASKTGNSEVRNDEDDGEGGLDIESDMRYVSLQELTHEGDEDEDEDVIRERSRVRMEEKNLLTTADSGRGEVGVHTPVPGPAILLSGLTKEYAPPCPSLGSGGYGCGCKLPVTRAVNSLSFAVSPGECFGFLGVNGAGKSSTIGMIVGQVQVTAGEGYVQGQSVRTRQTAVRQYIGYCEQNDTLFDLLTVREHLQLYGRLRGLGRSALEKGITLRLQQLHLLTSEHRLAGTLSGGNKRRLSLAIALLAEPPVLLLDEPSTGMDPAAKRFMWNIISDVCQTAAVSSRGDSTKDSQCGGDKSQGSSGGSASGSKTKPTTSVILTTHSMEEAEAICHRIGIMVKGRLRCIGTAQHLRLKYTHNTYQVDVTLNSINTQQVAKVLQQLVNQGLVKDKSQRAIATSRIAGEGVAGSEEELLQESQYWEFICNEATLNDTLLNHNVADNSESDPIHCRAACPPSSSSSSSSTMENGSDYLTTNGQSIVSWLHQWFAKKREHTLTLFLLRLHPTARLVERSSAYNFRYQIKLTSNTQQPINRNVATATHKNNSPTREENDVPVLGASATSLGQLFVALSEHQDSLFIQDFSVGLPSLEQIFNTIASK